MKLFTGPLGTFIKVFLSTMITLWIAMPDLFALDAQSIKALVSAGIVSGAPVILNWLNPRYAEYGKNKLPAKILSVEKELNDIEPE